MYKKFLFASAVILLLLSARLFNRYFSMGGYSHFSWKFWLISIALLLLTFSPLSSITFDSVGRKLYEAARKFFYFHFRNLWLFMAFLLIIDAGVFFRLYKIDCFPWGLEGLTIDSAGTGEYAFKILDGEPYTPIGWCIGGIQDTLSNYFIALFFLLFGTKLIVLRCAMLFLSVLNAILVFFVVKAILRKGSQQNSVNLILIALLGMGLYLFSAVDTVLIYSAFEGTITAPVVLASFLSLIFAFETNSPFSFCLAGLLYGLLLSSSKYFMPTSPAFIIVILYYAISSSCSRYKAERKGWYFKIGIFFLGTLFVALPKILWLLYNYNHYFYRVLMCIDADKTGKGSGLFNIINSIVSRLYSDSAIDTIKLMFFEGFSGKFLLAHTALIDKYILPIFFFGIIYSFVKIKSEGYLFLICYLCITIVMCIITLPNDYRFIPFMPFVYIFFSVGLNLISKSLKYRKIFYILAGIYLVVIVSFNVKNYYTGMGIAPLTSFYHVKNTLLGRHLQNHFIGKRVYVSLQCCEWSTEFSTYGYLERDIARPALGIWRVGQKNCDDYTYKYILSNISQIISESRHSKEDILFVFDEAACNDEIMSHLESALNKKRSSFNIYSKSCKQDFLFYTIEIKEKELHSIDTTRLMPH